MSADRSRHIDFVFGLRVLGKILLDSRIRRWGGDTELFAKFGKGEFRLLSSPEHCLGVLLDPGRSLFRDLKHVLPKPLFAKSGESVGGGVIYGKQCSTIT